MKRARSESPGHGVVNNNTTNGVKRDCNMNTSRMIINDSIHGHIVVPDICRRIIDTPQFDRLRGIKQLGTAHYVYPCAKHSRWEHSVGVMHLAGEFVKHLRDNEPECSDNKDRLAVMIAGLCHDLGHGPFSHLWETFVKEARPDCKWRHEQSSLDMLDFLIEENNLEPVFAEEGFTEKDMIFIKELINGPINGKEYEGRDPEKHFLYEIVANKTSGIDVDKWDYFLRDNQACNIGCTFDYKRYILMSGLKWNDEKRILCTEEKENVNIKKMFEDRARLHKQAYQHNVVKMMDQTILDILHAADQHLQICFDIDGNFVRMSKACDDPSVFQQLSDSHLFQAIQYSRENNLKKARDLCKRIACRKLYKHIGSLQCQGLKLSPEFEILKKSLLEKVKQEGDKVKVDDIVLCKKTISTGMGGTSPVERVQFVKSKEDACGYSSKFTEEMMSINEEEILIVSRSNDEGCVREAKSIFLEWSRNVVLPTGTVVLPQTADLSQ